MGAQEQFLADAYAAVLPELAKRGIPASAAPGFVGQLAVETAYGQSKNFRGRNNWAGIRGAKVDPGNTRGYRTYATKAEGAAEYFALLDRKYGGVLQAASGGNPYAVADAFGQSPWAATRYRIGGDGTDDKGGDAGKVLGQVGTEGKALYPAVKKALGQGSAYQAAVYRGGGKPENPGAVPVVPQPSLQQPLQQPGFAPLSVPQYQGYQVPQIPAVDFQALLGLAADRVSGQAPLPTSDALLAQLKSQREQALLNQLAGIDNLQSQAIQGIQGSRQRAGNDLRQTADGLTPDFAAILGQFAQGSPVQPGIQGQNVYSQALGDFGGDVGAFQAQQNPYNTLALQQEAVGGGVLAQTSQGVYDTIGNVYQQGLDGIQAAGEANAFVNGAQAKTRAQTLADEELFQLASQLGQTDLQNQVQRTNNAFPQTLDAFQALFGAASGQQGFALDQARLAQGQAQFDQSFAADAQQRAFQQSLSGAEFQAQQQQQQFTQGLQTQDQLLQAQQLQAQTEIGLADVKSREQVAKSSAVEELNKRALAFANTDLGKLVFAQGYDPTAFYRLPAQEQNNFLNRIPADKRTKALGAAKSKLTNAELAQQAAFDGAADNIKQYQNSLDANAKLFANGDADRKISELKISGSDSVQVDAALYYIATFKRDGDLSSGEQENALRKWAKEAPEVKSLPKKEQAKAINDWVKRKAITIQVLAGEGYIDSNGSFKLFTAQQRADLAPLYESSGSPAPDPTPIPKKTTPTAKKPQGKTFGVSAVGKAKAAGSK